MSFEIFFDHEKKKKSGSQNQSSSCMTIHFCCMDILRNIVYIYENINVVPFVVLIWACRCFLYLCYPVSEKWEFSCAVKGLRQTEFNEKAFICLSGVLENREKIKNYLQNVLLVCVYVCMCLNIYLYAHIPKQINIQIHVEVHMWVNMYLYIHVYVCIYIYIYSHPQTDCFILSELFSVARHAGCSKPESKPVKIYDRLRLQTTRPQADYVG